MSKIKSGISSSFTAEQQKQRRRVTVVQLPTVAKPEQNPLPQPEAGNADERPHRAPFRRHDIKGNQPEPRKADE